jgi:hypothetical protein
LKNLLKPYFVKILEMDDIKASKESIGNGCKICFDGVANAELIPCHHQGLCYKCSLQVETCPICRTAIVERLQIDA